MQQVQVRTPEAPGQPAIVTHVPAGTPQTAVEYRGLLAKRAELSEQANSASRRLNNLSEQLHSADPATRAAIQARMKELEVRIVRIDSDLDRISDQIANAPPQVMTGTTIDPGQVLNRVQDDLVPIVAMLSIFVFLPFTIAISRFIWRRAGASTRPAVADHASQQRMEKIQQSIDAIAIEVERISEGQRFVTKMMSERERPAVGAGAAEPLRASKKSAISTERG